MEEESRFMVKCVSISTHSLELTHSKQKESEPHHNLAIVKEAALCTVPKLSASLLMYINI